MKTATRMRSSSATILLVCLFASTAALAGESERTSRSSGRTLNDPITADAEVVMVKSGQASIADKYLPDGVAASKSRDANAAKHALNTDFWIYDADAVVYFDDDFDGFYSGLDVSFDADTVHIAADVYARLYLSLEGGPWILYYTTDVFTLVGSSGGDDYLVETDLIDGYPTGYYDVLIELYDYDYDEHVASFGPFETSALSALPLEDQFRDVGIVTPPIPPVSSSSGGGGSAGILLLCAAALTLLLRHRAMVRRRRKGTPGRP